MCGVCGEWMTQIELKKHRYEDHRGLDHVSSRSAKLVAMYTVPAGSVLVVLILLGGLDISWLGFPLILWAMLVFVILLVPVVVVASKPSNEAYANALFRCWVCDQRIPHRNLSRHLRENHPEIAHDFRVAEASFAAIAILLPPTFLLPQLWRFTDPSLQWYYYIGPELAMLTFLLIVGVYASRWPRRVARARSEWEATHPAA